MKKLSVLILLLGFSQASLALWSCADKEDGSGILFCACVPGASHTVAECGKLLYDACGRPNASGDNYHFGADGAVCYP